MKQACTINPIKTDSLNAIIHDITRSILMIGVVIYFFWFETLTIN